jgi:hypothetical protein
MRKALRKAGWTLAAAGSIGITAPAEAQPPAGRILGPGGHVQQTGEAVVTTEHQAALEEGQVELALLAEPMLFSYGLAAHAEGVGLEIRGFIPNEAVREHALKVAREHTALPVHDRLKVFPGITTRTSIDKPENIQRAAKELLEETFPVHGRGMDVKCDARGRVTVTGKAASHEDKVLVSRKLRQVRGCSCVVNEVSVVTTVPVVQPAEPTRKEQVFPDPPPVTVRPAVRTPAPQSVPSRPVAAPVLKPSEPPVPVKPSVSHRAATPVPDVQPLPEPAPLPRTPTPPPITVLPAPRPVTPGSEPVILERPPTPPAPVPRIDNGHSYAPVPTQQLPPVSAPKPPPMVNVPDVKSAPPPAVKLPEIVIPSAPPVKAPPAPPPAPWGKPTLPPVPITSSAPAAPNQERGGSEDAIVSDGFVTFGDDPPPARSVNKASVKTSTVSPSAGTITLTPPPMPSSKPAPPPPTVTEPPLPPSKPALLVPTATVPASDLAPVAATVPPLPQSKPKSAPVTATVPPVPVAAAPAPPSVPAAARLKERIQAVCGPAYEVKVTATKETAFTVFIRGQKPGDEERLMERLKPVIAAAEFDGCDIDCDIIAPK